MSYSLPDECSWCAVDLRALNRWRRLGGEFPARVCPADHRPVCTVCLRERTERKSGMCEDCIDLPRPIPDSREARS